MHNTRFEVSWLLKWVTIICDHTEIEEISEPWSVLLVSAWLSYLVLVIVYLLLKLSMWLWSFFVKWNTFHSIRIQLPDSIVRSFTENIGFWSFSAITLHLKTLFRFLFIRRESQFHKYDGLFDFCRTFV